MTDKIQHTRGPWTLLVRRKGWPHVMGADHCRVTVVDDTHIGYETQANERLIALAPTAPHNCDHEGCPGRENKRKLEAAAALHAALTEILSNAQLDIDDGELALSCLSGVRYAARAAIARWEGR